MGETQGVKRLLEGSGTYTVIHAHMLTKVCTYIHIYCIYIYIHTYTCNYSRLYLYMHR